MTTDLSVVYQQNGIALFNVPVEQLIMVYQAAAAWLNSDSEGGLHWQARASMPDICSHQQKEDGCRINHA